MIQWKDLERITKENEAEKTVIYSIYHNPSDYPVVRMIPDSTVEPGRVYFGDYKTFNKITDSTFEAKCKEQQKIIEKLENELRKERKLIEKIDTLIFKRNIGTF